MAKEVDLRFQNALYTGNDVPEVIKIYEESLRNSNSLADIAHATKLEEYRQQITNRNYLYRLRSFFNQFYRLVDKGFPNIHFVIDGRRKSLVSTEKKILKLLGENRSLDLMRDIFAFRITIFSSHSSQSDDINTCYQVANQIIEFSLKKGLTLCEAELSSEPFDKEKHPEVLIPKESGIRFGFGFGVKDYIINPKSNGYQSLHILLKATTGEYFEVQVRSFNMHLHAESGDANHLGYKSKKYKNVALKIESEKVHIPGYGISKSGKVFDFVGVEEGLEILKRQKTY